MSEDPGPRTAVAINVELGGRREASARLELCEGAGAPRLARVALRGWIDRAAERRLEQALAAFAPRGVSGVVLDCSEVRRVEGRQMARILAAVARLDGGPVEVWGLPRRLWAGWKRRGPAGGADDAVVPAFPAAPPGGDPGPVRDHGNEIGPGGDLAP